MYNEMIEAESYETYANFEVNKVEYKVMKPSKQNDFI